MEGYVKNKTVVWRHAMKRNIGPGQTISLDELYKQYGEKHDLEEGKPFVEWLKQIKVADTHIWEVIYSDEKGAKKTGKVKKAHAEVKEEIVVPHVKKELEPDEIVSFSVRKAREELPKITNAKLLKYALSSANQLADKDTLCQMLRKRLSMLELSRR
jgi:hypothetical protein